MTVRTPMLGRLSIVKDVAGSVTSYVHAEGIDSSASKVYSSGGAAVSRPSWGGAVWRTRLAMIGP